VAHAAACWKVVLPIVVPPTLLLVPTSFRGATVDHARSISATVEVVMEIFLILGLSLAPRSTLSADHKGVIHSVDPRGCILDHGLDSSHYRSLGDNLVKLLVNRNEVLLWHGI
jgi:hypothetical protein